MANDDNSEGARWARTVVDEVRRFHSLRRRQGRVFRYTPMPPSVKAEVDRSLAIWPVPQSTRDRTVALVAQKISGRRQSRQRRIHPLVQEPEASRVAAAAEAEGLAAAAAYAAGKSVATDEERADVFRYYVKEMWASAYRHANSLPQAAAGTSGSGPAAQLPPPVASVAGPAAQPPPLVTGPVQQLALPSASAPPAPAAPEK